MRSRSKVLVIAGSLLTPSLGASATAATSTVPVTDTSTFACGNGICEVGPGNVGMPFAAELNVSGLGGSVTIPLTVNTNTPERAAPGSSCPAGSRMSAGNYATGHFGLAIQS